jgi:hypothetical protein
MRRREWRTGKLAGMEFSFLLAIDPTGLTIHHYLELELKEFVRVCIWLLIFDCISSIRINPWVKAFSRCSR